MATVANLKVDQGATFRGNGPITTSSGTAVNLVGATARMQIRQRYGLQNALLELNTINGGLAFDTANGAVLIVMTPEQTTALLPDGATTSETLVYDLYVQLAANGSTPGDTYRVYQGTILVSPAVTQPPTS